MGGPAETSGWAASAPGLASARNSPAAYGMLARSNEAGAVDQAALQV